MSYLQKPENPCKKDCPYRDTFCKLDCEDYKEYEEKYKEFSEAITAARKREEPAIQYRKEILNKQRKRRSRHG